MNADRLADLYRQQMESARRDYDGHGRKRYAVSGREMGHRRRRRRAHAWVRMMLRWFA
ncbi:MAG: hypothetical protein ACRDJE_24565 [Dehalococcoidia bacterium]